jgi:hypothetical protein
MVQAAPGEAHTSLSGATRLHYRYPGPLRGRGRRSGCPGGPARSIFGPCF